MRIEEVTYEMAEPAKKLQVLLWLVSLGKKGKLFVPKKRKYNKFFADVDARTVNCRSSITKL